LRVVVVHNRYRSAQPSGENRVVDDQIAMLRNAGVEVIPYIRDSDEIDRFTAVGKLGVGVRTIASPTDALALRRLIARSRPDVVHLHNPYPLLSPSVVRTAKNQLVPVVQTVHNYRFACSNGLYFRDGAPCRDCLGKRVPWPSVAHACYRSSHLQSTAMAASFEAHRPTWQMVDRYLAISRFVSEQLQRAGVPAERISVVRNPVADPGSPTPPGSGALFLGRLDDAKGVGLLLEAWKSSGLGERTTLTIAGDGPERPRVEDAAGSLPGLVYLGAVPPNDVGSLYRAAAVVIVPSIWDEPFGLVAAEALSYGRPVVATRVGGLSELVDEGTGWLAEPRADDLARQMSAALHDRKCLMQRGANARRFYEAELDPASATAATLSAYHELASAPRGSVSLVGPDGVGKSTISSGLRKVGTNAGVPVVVSHFRPGVLDRRPLGRDPVTEPHAQPPRPLHEAVAKVGFTWADMLVGAIGPWRRARLRGLLIQERPWYDQVVDPRRYRLPRQLGPLLRALGRLLPRTDLEVHLVGDPSGITARKPELPEPEIRRQLAAWHELTGRTGRRSITVPTDDRPPAASVAEIQRALRPRRPEPMAADWRHLPLTPGRLALVSTADPPSTSSATIYQPQRPRAQAGYRISLGLHRLGLTRAAGSPPLPLGEMLEAAELEADGLTVMRSSAPGRWIVGIERAGRLQHVAKIGALSDAGLEKEVATLGALAGQNTALLIPRLRWSGSVDGFSAMVTSALPARSTQPVTIDDAARVATELCRGSVGGQHRTHGDLAPWNLTRTSAGLALHDWEDSRAVFDPLADLTHFVAQSGALLGWWSPAAAVELLASDGGPGARHLDALGEDGDDASGILATILRRPMSVAASQREREYRSAMAEELRCEY
jgi:glycosyltransferase involved in cell wall biosynthesis